jgi:hypothetical protein
LRCQSYGHTRKYWMKTFNCVKCAGPHDTKDYSKPKDAPTTCVLCKGAHPANYKGPNVYLHLLKLKYKDTYSNNPNTPNANRHPHLQTINHQQTANSYSQAAANSFTPQTRNNSHLGNLMGNFLHEFKNMFNQLLHQNSIIINMLTIMMSKLSH